MLDESSLLASVIPVPGHHLLAGPFAIPELYAYPSFAPQSAITT